MSTTALTQSAVPAAIAGNRCDRCGALAEVQVVLSGGGELVFCAHHGRAHWAVLARQGAEFRPFGDQ